MGGPSSCLGCNAPRMPVRRWSSRPFAALVVALLVVAACSGSGDDADEGATGDGGGTTTTAAPAEGDADAVRMNEVQVLGSHNSYHQRPAPQVLDTVRALAPDLVGELDYGHLPITEQLETYGVRQLELDVYADPDGGRFADRPSMQIVGLPTESGDPSLDEPGAKVLHIADLDFNTSCSTFVACLTEVQAWSADHPDHLPIMILVEAKEDSLATVTADVGIDLSGTGIAFTQALPWTRELFDDLEADILSVFDRSAIITPDDVRGDAATLEEAVLAGDAWPTLDDARGRVLFSLVDVDERRDTYVGDATSLEGRLMFTSSEEGRPDAAVLRIDDSLVDGDRLRAAVEAGYLVRTRTDVPAVHAPAGDTTLRDAALASGAQYVSTDYYVEDPALGTGYVVTIPEDEGSILGARCDPVTARAGCSLR